MTELPTIRVYQSEMDRLFALYAALQELELAERDMQRRINAVPGGLSDLQLIKDTLSRFLEAVVATIPPEKLASIQRMLPRMAYKVYFNGVVSQMMDDATGVKIKDLDTLCKAAHEHCVLCDDKCDRCKLGIGKVFDRVLKVDREGESWTFFNFDNLMGGA